MDLITVPVPPQGYSKHNGGDSKAQVALLQVPFPHKEMAGAIEGTQTKHGQVSLLRQ